MKFDRVINFKMGCGVHGYITEPLSKCATALVLFAFAFVVLHIATPVLFYSSYSHQEHAKFSSGTYWKHFRADLDKNIIIGLEAISDKDPECAGL